MLKYIVIHPADNVEMQVACSKRLLIDECVLSILCEIR